MTRRGKRRVATGSLGIHAEAGAWCTIGKVPHSPADVLRAADDPRFHPARTPPLGMVGAVLGAPFIPVITFFELLAGTEEAVMRSLDTRDGKERSRARREDEERRRDAAVRQGLDKVFDGDRHGGAGQFLLRWYSRSAHHQRLLLATRDGIVLAAPPRRVSVGREKHLQVVARPSAAEATLVDPFSGEFGTRMPLIRFQDGSWLRVDTEELRSDLHTHVLRQPSADI